MIHNAVGLSVVTILAALVTFAVRLGRRKDCPTFSGWWDSEGMPIFILVWFAILILAFLKGWA